MTKPKSESENQNWEDEIISFLSEREEKTFTSQKIMGGLNLHTEFSTPETAKMSTFAIADFTVLLFDLVRKRKVEMKVIRGRMHFRASGDITKCPKCGMGVSTPRKSWKMAGRPDKTGKRTELTIGLFDHCGKTFRAVLAKRKI